LLLAAGAGILLLSFATVARSQNAGHPNTLTIVHEDDKNLVFQFSLNLPQVLHQLLSPATPLPAFLQSYAHMPPPAWERALQNAKRLLSASGVLTVPGGRPIRLQAWQWPDDAAIAQSLKMQEILLPMAEASRPHLDPVPVQARLQSPKPIRQAQLQLPVALYPIEVTIQNDKFWLTSQIPLAMVNLE
jgi:hypothetical protein